MNQCGTLAHAENVYAYYAAAEKHVVIVAEVFVNPYTQHAHICPNPIAMPLPAGGHEFIVESFARHTTGMHPPIEVKERVTYSFAADATPRSVVVYTMGVDAPSRQEVAVGSAPPPATAPTARAAVASSPSAPTATAVKSAEVVGYSQTFSFEEAIQDALTQARARFPSPPANPDLGVTIVVKTMTAHAGGNMRPGLHITATAS